MKHNESWQGNFANRNIKGHVPWGPNNCKMCPRWFINGYCFEDCAHAASHVKASEVPADKKSAFSNFMEAICKEANWRFGLRPSSARPPKKPPDADKLQADEPPSRRYRPSPAPPEITSQQQHTSLNSSTLTRTPPHAPLPLRTPISTPPLFAREPANLATPNIGVAECILGECHTNKCDLPFDANDGAVVHPKQVRGDAECKDDGRSHSPHLNFPQEVTALAETNSSAPTRTTSLDQHPVHTSAARAQQHAHR